MTAPERIWAEHRTCTVDASGASRLLAMDQEFARGTEYIRADLLETHIGAVLAEAENARLLEAVEPLDLVKKANACVAALIVYGSDKDQETADIITSLIAALTALDRAKREARVEFAAEIVSMLTAMRGPVDVPRTERAVWVDEGIDRCIGEINDLIAAEERETLPTIKLTEAEASKMERIHASGPRVTPAMRAIAEERASGEGE